METRIAVFQLRTFFHHPRAYEKWAASAQELQSDRPASSAVFSLPRESALQETTDVIV
jgi:hypothetical protein